MARAIQAVGVVGDVDYRIQISPDKVKTCIISLACGCKNETAGSGIIYIFNIL